ncbi:unnamed protein product [Strongylus vulgaris]|uniref:Uncharacterized protein n=1 Tax=Strongylus vulgaris TaxID=40348 RepID=A0A3P7J3W4_STRVU|nr:unnamed protein product [Strongylus vulgaris]
MKCVGMFVAAGLYWIFVNDESSYYDWRYAYWLQGIFLIVVRISFLHDPSKFCSNANFMFYIIATDQPATFTLITRATREAAIETKKRIDNGKKDTAGFLAHLIIISSHDAFMKMFFAQIIRDTAKSLLMVSEFYRNRLVMQRCSIRTTNPRLNNTELFFHSINNGVGQVFRSTFQAVTRMDYRKPLVY